MKVDPALLVSLEALLRLQSVTAAAAEQHITQSAMSQRLKRLRAHLGDPLLVVVGGRSVLTGRAEAMQAPLRQALEALAQATELGTDFTPETAQRTFTVASPDVGELFVLPRLMACLQAQAPGVRVFFRRPAREPERMMADLERGTMDLAVGAPEVVGRAGFRTRVIGHEGFAMLCRQDHPILGPGATLADYLRCRHLVVSTSTSPGGMVDEALSKHGVSRSVVARVSHFVSAPFVVAQSDLVLLTGRSLALRMARELPLQLLEPPLPLPQVAVRMLWHDRSHHDAGHRWLRELSRTVTLETFTALTSA